ASVLPAPTAAAGGGRAGAPTASEPSGPRVEQPAQLPGELLGTQTKHPEDALGTVVGPDARLIELLVEPDVLDERVGQPPHHSPLGDCHQQVLEEPDLDGQGAPSPPSCFPG